MCFSHFVLVANISHVSNLTILCRLVLLLVESVGTCMREDEVMCGNVACIFTTWWLGACLIAFVGDYIGLIVGDPVLHLHHKQTDMCFHGINTTLIYCIICLTPFSAVF